ncbi:MAG: hypothetical protein ACTTHU_00185 [Treponema sp.]
MKRNIFSSAKLFFLSASKIIIISILICALSSFVTVFPLYMFASKSPGTYSIVITLICAASLIYFLVKKLRTTSVKKILKSVVILGICAAGIIVSVKLLLYGTRLFALISFAAAVILCVLASKLIRYNEKKN